LQRVGIICEYNPLHLGHQKQIQAVRHMAGGDCAVVCLMSGNFVQRGHPAVFDKRYRAQAAVACGADLVLELPVTYALSSAEGFAAGGVSILSRICDTLCFGAETADTDTLLGTARALLSPDFSGALRSQLEKGISFPAARQAALESLGLNASVLDTPNNILAVEYCKAILSQGSSLTALPIHRGGSYHDDLPDPENPSATSLRRLIADGQEWAQYVPQEAAAIFCSAAVHDLSYGEKAVLARLRTMTEGEFESLPYGSEGLWRKFMHACRREASLEAILSATKSKRYTRARLDRMAMCAFLGLTAADLAVPAPYTRILAFNDRGRGILNSAKDSAFFINAGEDVSEPYQAIEQRCGSLYGLFASTPEGPDRAKNERVYYARKYE